MPCSAGRPSLDADGVHFAPAAPKRTSAKQASTKPTPATAPLTAAITGLATASGKANTVP